MKMNQFSQDLQELIQYFGLTDRPKQEKLYDVKTGTSCALLSYMLQKILPVNLLGFNSASRELHKIQSQLQEIHKVTCSFIPTGSLVEGLFVLSIRSVCHFSMSDTDTFIVPQTENLPSIHVFEYTTNEPNSYPGYAHITIAGTNNPLKKCTEDIPDLDQFLGDLVPNIIQNKTASQQQTFNEQGLSYEQVEQTKEVTFKLKVKSSKIAAEGSSDLVYAYPTKEWPGVAQAWINRPRPANWPMRTLINDIVAQGAHYVKKSPAHMSDAELLPYIWRISFSLAERDLCREFTDTQRQCAMMMKLVKEHLLKTNKESVEEVGVGNGPETVEQPKQCITSYHMKTLMLWACEQIPECHWKPGRVAQCFLMMLDRLYLALVQGWLPHYFIPELNLLSANSRQSMLECARLVLNVRKHPLLFMNKVSTTYMRHMYIPWNPEMQISFGNEEVHQVLNQLPNQFSVLQLFTMLYIIQAKITYQKTHILHAFIQHMQDLEYMIDTVSDVMSLSEDTYKQVMFTKLVDLAVVCVFSEADIHPYYEYHNIKNWKQTHTEYNLGSKMNIKIDNSSPDDNEKSQDKQSSKFDDSKKSQDIQKVNQHKVFYKDLETELQRTEGVSTTLMLFRPLLPILLLLFQRKR